MRFLQLLYGLALILIRKVRTLAKQKANSLLLIANCYQAMKDFRQIQVWHKAHKLVLDVYRATRDFSTDERYGLTSQIRRAAASIPTNIAEGCGKSTDKDFARYLQMSYGSANEVDYLLLLAKDLSMLSPEIYDNINSTLIEVRKMLAALIRKVRL